MRTDEEGRKILTHITCVLHLEGSPHVSLIAIVGFKEAIQDRSLKGVTFAGLAHTSDKAFDLLVGSLGFFPTEEVAPICQLLREDWGRWDKVRMFPQRAHYELQYPRDEKLVEYLAELFIEELNKTMNDEATMQ